ncbi:cation transporter [Streptomyces longwoodensis]|uniref:heavy-metal-associated domain-containing protein n=1 Tax=Streptomyces longwoodensis TaxID=68231 RepID=UPI0036ED000E
MTDMTEQTNSSSCCGGSGGSCGSGTATDVQGIGITTVYKVSGMTCGHCESSVSNEIGALDGVTSVTAVAKTGEVTVISTAPLDEAAVRAAVDEAGYELVGQA